jgi:CheY-like chemotaxis protein
MSTVLVIDDNKDYRKSFRKVLELENYEALEAENGLTGIAMIRHHLPDIILCDIEMPVMNGIDVLRKVKAVPLWAKIPFVIISGHSNQHIVQAAYDLGVAAYLTKPVTIVELLAVIIRFLGANAAL